MTASYFMGIEAAVPVISLVVEPSVLWDEDEGLLEALMSGAWNGNGRPTSPI
ncbi:MAG: hypothetical protein R3E31_29010 [Chloroflexota bacterium]